MPRWSKGFFVSLDELKASNILFDFITINDVLCEADNPAQILETVYDCLADDGIFFVKDTDFEIHPWPLYMIQGCSFLTKKHTKNILERFNFDVLNIDMGFEQKNIAILCKKGRYSRKSIQNDYELNKYIYNQSIEYLDRAIDTVREYLKQNINIGIFGTSIAGVWLSQIITNEERTCSDAKIFYIDEDEECLKKRIGVNGYPIYRPEEVVEPTIVFFCHFPDI